MKSPQIVLVTIRNTVLAGITDHRVSYILPPSVLEKRFWGMLAGAARFPAIRPRPD